MPALTLSLCMILRDEAPNLGRSLGPAAQAFDEVVVVDTGSMDGTQDQARALGARVIDIPWPHDFAQARNVSIDHAQGDYILWLDGDNQIRPAAVDRIRKGLDPDKRTVYWCVEVVVPQGERLVQKRVFPRRPDVFFKGKVHEQLMHPRDFASVVVPVEILHWGYQHPAEARKKGLRNLDLLTALVRESPDDPYPMYQLGRTLLNLRRFKDARTWLKQFLRHPRSAELNPPLFLHGHLLLADVLLRLDEPETAESLLAGLAEREPDYRPGRLAYGRLLYRNERYEAAASQLEAFLAGGPLDPVAGFNEAKMAFSALMMLGRCRESLGRPDQAGAAYRAAGAMDPRHLEPVRSLARLAGGSKDGSTGRSAPDPTAALEARDREEFS